MKIILSRCTLYIVHPTFKPLPVTVKYSFNQFYCSTICTVQNVDLEIADQCQYWLEGVMLVSATILD